MEAHLVAQVAARQTLRAGTDVVEVDSWGMDCYSRKNIVDAIMEAGVWEHLRGLPPHPKEEGGRAGGGCVCCCAWCWV